MSMRPSLSAIAAPSRDQPSGDTPALRTPGAARPKVVVIDASAAAISLYERSVKSLGVDLAVFEASQTSLAYLKHNPADLIFLELMVPGQDGLSLLRELRADGQHARTPIIVVTSKVYLQDRNQAQALGVINFLAKPLRSQEIRALIQHHVKSAADQTDSRGDGAQ